MALDFIIKDVAARVGTIPSIASNVSALLTTGGGTYRPAEWEQSPVTVLTIPGQSSSNPIQSQVAGISDAPGFSGTPDTLVVFDAILTATHESELRSTEFPVQTGANITDHAMLMPKRITLEIGMSDAQQSFYATNFTGASSKSVAAHQLMLQLQADRTLVSLTSRLKFYQNLLVKFVSAPDTIKTKHGLRMMVVLEEVRIATVTAVSSGLVFDSTDPVSTSARPQDTAKTAVGSVQSSSIPAAVTQQHSISGDFYNALPYNYQLNTFTVQRIVRSVPGAGSWSSMALSSLPLDLPGLVTKFNPFSKSDG